MKIEIKNRWVGTVIYSHDCEGNTWMLTLIKAIFEGVNLINSDLSNCDLRGIDLSNCDLSGCDLSHSDLSYSDLSKCDLSNCDLSSSSLIGCKISGSNLSDSNLTPIRDDIWAILASAPNEVPGLIFAIKEGRIDGSTYEGKCACLVGTIANIKKIDKNSIFGLSISSNRPAERFFLGIMAGDTPETSQFSALALKWCEEWLGRMQAAFGEKK